MIMVNKGKTKKKKHTTAENLERIANALEEFSKAQVGLIEHPEQFANRIREVTEEIAVPRIMPDTLEGELPEGTAAVQYQIVLSDEEREKIVTAAMESIAPEFDRMRMFVSDALKELPEPTLKKIGEHLAKGEVPQFRRRRGCVHLDFGYGDEEFYLRL